MSIAGIPEVVHDFNMYNTGNKLIGMTGEVAIPDFEAMTETIAGAGLLGEYEATIPGHYGSMEQEIPFRCIDEDYFKLISPSESVELMLRGALQYNVKATQNVDYMGMRIVYRGRCKKIVIGTVKQHGQMDSSVTIELTYILIEMDGKKRVELDKINGVFRVNDVDKLAKVKALT